MEGNPHAGLLVKTHAGLLVEIDGEGVSPETVDSVALLRLAGSFVELVVKVAKHHGHKLSLNGVQIIDKCAAAFIPIEPELLELVRPLARESRELLRSPRVPRGLGAAVERTRKALRLVPDENTARIAAGDWSDSIKAATLQEAFPGVHIGQRRMLAAAVTTFRATLVSLSAKPTPVARFEKPGQADEVVLDVDLEQARELGPHMGTQLDITARVRCNKALNIVSGSLIDFVPMDDRDPLEALEAIFRESDLDTIDDHA